MSLSHCTAYLSKMAGTRFNERPCVSKRKWRINDEDTDICLCLPDVHTLVSTHTHTHTPKDFGFKRNIFTKRTRTYTSVTGHFSSLTVPLDYLHHIA